MTVNPNTISYRGYEIDPISDPDLNGAWPVCALAEATCFRAYPPDLDQPCLDVEMYTLEAAKAAVDAELAGSRE